MGAYTILKKPKRIEFSKSNGGSSQGMVEGREFDPVNCTTSVDYSKVAQGANRVEKMPLG
jgi:hypothetical protein